jgi:hypothetical protein
VLVMKREIYSGKPDLPYNTEFSALQIMKNSRCLRKVHQVLLCPQREFRPLPVTGIVYKRHTRREELHPVTNIKHHPLPDRVWPVRDQFCPASERG